MANFDLAERASIEADRRESCQTRAVDGRAMDSTALMSTSSS